MYHFESILSPKNQFINVFRYINIFRNRYDNKTIVVLNTVECIKLK